VLHPEWYTRRSHRKRIISAARKYIRGKTLDVGSGDQYYKEILRGTFSTYVSLDKVEYWGPDNTNPPPDIAGDAENIPLTDGEFDSALLIEVLEHCLEYQKVLDETSRILKQDGYLLMTVPFLIWVHGAPYDYFRYTRNTLPIILQRAGLSIVELKNTCGAGGVVASLLNTVTDTTYGFSRTRKIFHIFFVGPLLPIFWFAMNMFAVVFDKLFPNENYPFGYVIIAKKTGTPGSK